ncbi:MAG TPA: S8 family serine peptidase, partial [Anaerolineaceae bacterium]|nr:S8 family serine peptidase [Anaerolineaceae bacterium]
MARKILNLVLGISLLIGLIGFSSSPVVFGIDEQEIISEFPYASDHLIVKLRPEVRLDKHSLTTHVSSLDRMLTNLQATEFRQVRGLLDTYRLELATGHDILSAVAALNEDPAVEYAEPDYLAHFASVPNDPRYAEQWGLEKIQVEGAWDQTMGDPNVIIAVIDSGIDLTHEDLSPNLWTNPGEIAGNGLDDDNNDFVDDTRGWNFVNSTNEVDDSIGHGSLVAGVAAAKINNEIGVAGVCGNCSIMPVKVSQASGIANYSDIAAGVAYAAQKGASVINISLGGYADSITLKNAINAAVAQNIVVVAGAGNDNSSNLFYPAAYENVIAVAGTDENDVKVDSSNYGGWVDVSAPGVDILSTTLGGYSSDSGTSYTSPFVAGVAGLLLSQHPDWTPAMIQGQFAHMSDNIDSLNAGFEGMLGAGRINATQAMLPSQPILEYVSYEGNGTPNLRPDFGSTVLLTVSLTNDWADALSVTGTLSSTDGYVTITTASSSFGDILAGETKANVVPFSFNIAAGAGYNHSMPFSLVLSANGGVYTTTIDFTITTRSSEETFFGMIETNTTWTSDKTYKIIGNVGVASTCTLTIEPGTVIKFDGNFNLNIGGTLIAQGTAEQPIHFEPYVEGNTWGQIFFADSSSDAVTSVEGAYLSGNILQHVQIIGATSGIGCTSATPFLDQVKTDRGGVSCSLGGTDLWLTNSTLIGEVYINGGGITPEHVSGLEVSGGNVNLPASEVADSQIDGSLSVNGRGEIYGLSIRGSLSVGENSTVSQSEVRAGGISSESGSTITHNNIEDAIGGGINIIGSSTVTFNRVVGAGQGIVASAGIVENNLLANITGDGLRPGTASVRNNTFIEIAGNAVYLDQVPTAFEYNNFEFNTGTYDVYVSVQNSLTSEISADNNWWGTTDSNLIKTRIFDYSDGELYLAKLIVDPFLTNPSQEAPAYVRGVTLDPGSPVGIQTVNFTVEFSRPMDMNQEPQLEFLSSDADSWTTKVPMPTSRSQFGVVAANNGKIYAIGGINNVNSVEEYDPQTDTWTTKAPMPTGRYDLGVAAAANGKIYAIGGQNAGNAVEEYDPQTDTWTTKTPMPTGRYDLGVAAANNGKIYAIGGHGGNNVVEEYDPQTDTWTTKAPMPTGRYDLGVAAAANGKIYAIGGQNAGNAVEEYDPQTDTWTSKAPMPTSRFSLGVVAAANGKIYAIGGEDCSFFASLNAVEEYDPNTNTWTTKVSMPTSRFGLGLAAADNGRIYAVGGKDEYYYHNEIEEYTTSDWGLAAVNDTPQWLDQAHFHASHDFTSIVERGEYVVSMQSAMGNDGILVAPFQGAYFLVDYAGEI